MISVNNISKFYDKVQALRSISFEVEKGELFGLIGPDGAGKTSIFRILATLLLPDAGSVTLDGMDAVKDYRKLRRIIGYMPGRFSLYQDLSIQENLNFFATIFGTSIKENYDLIEEIYVQLEPFKNRRAGQLSGGMKQKLALCCALIHKPRILLLDEPTTGVDPVSRKEFWEILGRLKAHGITILVSTPYMDEASLCDRVALIQDGDIFSIDTPANIRAAFPHTLWKLQGKSTYRMLRGLETWEATHSAHAFGDSVHFSPRKADLSADAIRTFFQEQGIELESLEQIQPDIEDCFMEAMIKEVDHA
jgi:ABC-type multidrug transport system ATPase subunit